jgi:hypothetical protein
MTKHVRSKKEAGAVQPKVDWKALSIVQSTTVSPRIPARTRFTAWFTKSSATPIWTPITWFNDLQRGTCTGAACSNFATPVDVKNDYGLTLGGPVIVPHFYNGKDKTFFLFRLGATAVAAQFGRAGYNFCTVFDSAQ